MAAAGVDVRELLEQVRAKASPAAVKDYMLIKGANHYYSDQPRHLQEVVNGTVDWLVRNGLAG